MTLRANIPGWERTVRILLGAGILALVFVGPRSAWGWLGLIPLATAFVGFCPLYSLIGFLVPRHGIEADAMGLMGRVMTGHAKGERMDLKRPVTVLLFTARNECDECDATEQMLRDLVERHDLLSLEVRFARTEAALMARLGVDQVPAIVLEGPAGNRVRFYGLPAGLEVPAFMEALLEVSAGKAVVTKAAGAMLAGLTVPVSMQVFVTPTCPWCPPAVRTANRFATALPNVTAITVESSSYPELAAANGVMSVPHVVINGRETWDGDGGDVALAAAILRATKPMAPA